MKRYFYRDPLAILWMARHYGMRFDVDAVTLKMNGADFRYLAHIIVTRDLLSADYIRRYVNPDSLPLLLPKEGDEGIDMRERQVRRINGGWHIYVPEELEFAGDIYSTLITKIDKRNGIPFHWPEEEATGDNA